MGWMYCTLFSTQKYCVRFSKIISEYCISFQIFDEPEYRDLDGENPDHLHDYNPDMYDVSTVSDDVPIMNLLNDVR